MNSFNITPDIFRKDCMKLADQIKWSKYSSVYPIPKNGFAVLCEVNRHAEKDLKILYNPAEINAFTLIIDDLIDSGKTIINLKKEYHLNISDFYVLYRKNDNNSILPGTSVYYVKDIEPITWINFPWEIKREDEDSHIIRLLEHKGLGINKENIGKIRKFLTAL